VSVPEPGNTIRAAVRDAVLVGDSDNEPALAARSMSPTRLFGSQILGGDSTSFTFCRFERPATFGEDIKEMMARHLIFEGSPNFARLHVMGDHRRTTLRFGDLERAQLWLILQSAYDIKVAQSLAGIKNCPRGSPATSLAQRKAVPSGAHDWARKRG